MHPIAFELPGGFEIHSYGVMGAVAFLVGCAIVLLRARQQGFDLNRVSDVIFWMAIGSLLGSRLVFVLQHPEIVESVGDFFDLRKGGLVFYGSFVVGIPLGFLLMARAKLPAFALFDIFATAAPLAHGISRVGCYLAGCCWGLPSDGPFAVTYPDHAPIAPGGVPVHPVQLYEAFALAGIAGITNLFYARRRFDGQVFMLYLLLYAVLRSITETYRGDISRGFFLPELLGETLSFSQGMSILVAIAAIAVFFFGARFSSPPTAASPAPSDPQP